MISKNELVRAIDELQELPCNYQNCQKLAVFLTLYDKLYDEPQERGINAGSKTEFSRAIDGKNMADILPVLDELFEALQVFNPRLYTSSIKKLKETVGQ